MSQQELVRLVIQALTDAGLDYMVTGSLVSSLQGEPRSTHDIDIVVLLTEADAARLTRAFPPPDFYLSEQAVLAAVRQRSMFNLLHLPSGEKADFWLLTDEPFDRSRFARKRAEDLLGLQVNVSAPEDTILAKLRWAELSGGSEKQFTDALHVYELQRAQMDLAYVNHWAGQLGVEALWKRLQSEAEPV